LRYPFVHLTGEQVLRLLPEGPSIPDELLVARDEGQVVFCGAGVSRVRAGLSDLLGLAKAVADKLAIVADSSTRKLIDAIERFPTITGVGSLVSADRVFALMEREFLARDIYEAIASSLVARSRSRRRSLPPAERSYAQMTLYPQPVQQSGVEFPAGRNSTFAAGPNTRY
jgi:hypothetical protein